MHPELGLRCAGASGAITRITGIGVHQRVITGLPSIAAINGNTAFGAHDIDFGFSSAWVTIGFGNNPANRAPFEAAGLRFGRLLQVAFTGQTSYPIDISAHEAATNPDGNHVDSNPFGLRLLSDRAVLTDAGANALLQISATGALSTLAVFPDRTVTTPTGDATIQSVPTAVTVAPDGSYFVGELTGAPFPSGSARVYRVPASGGTPQVVASGFTNIIDIVFDTATNTGYVLEHDRDGLIPPLGPSVFGRLVRIDGSGATVIASDGLVRPGGMTIGPDGAIYVTTFSDTAGAGQVVRIVP
jgi:sugar lactone lactonase YvrE